VGALGEQSHGPPRGQGVEDSNSERRLTSHDPDRTRPDRDCSPFAQVPAPARHPRITQIKPPLSTNKHDVSPIPNTQRLRDDSASCRKIPRLSLITVHRQPPLLRFGRLFLPLGATFHSPSDLSNTFITQQPRELNSLIPVFINKQRRSISFLKPKTP